MDLPIILGESCTGQPRQGHCRSRLQDSLHQHSKVLRDTFYPPVRQIRQRVTRRGFRFITEKGDRACPREQIGRLLLDILSRPQEDGRVKTDIKPKTHQRSNQKPILQDGDSDISNSWSKPRRLDRIIRSKRCIFPYSDTSGIQKVPQIFDKTAMLPVSSPSLRTFNITQSVHEVSRSDNGDTSSPGDTRFPVSGRYSLQRRVKKYTQHTVTDRIENANSGGVYSEPEKIVSNTYSGLGIPGCPYSDKRRENINTDREGRENNTHGGIVPCEQDVYGPQMAATSGSTIGNHTNDTSGKITDETHPMAPTFTVEQDQTVIRSTDQSNKRSIHPSPVVEGYKQPSIRFMPIPSARTLCHHNRCILARLGRSHRQTKAHGTENGPGSVDIQTTGVAHQLQRDDGSIPIPKTFQRYDKESQGTDSVGQHDHLCVYQQGRRNTIPQPMSTGRSNMGMVHSKRSRSQSGTCARSSKYHSRFSVQTHNRPERMDLTRSGGTPDFHLLGSTTSGPICNLSQLQGSHVLFALPIPGSISPGRILARMGQVYDGLCISANSPHSKSATEGQIGSSEINSNSATVADEVMVHDDTPVARRSTESTTTPIGPPVAIPDPPSESIQPQSDGLETQRHTLRAEGFSDQVISTILRSRASSTLAGYNAKWKLFIRWCHGRQLDPHNTSVTDICSFLQMKLEEGIQWQTLKGYVAAISACHKQFTIHSLGKDRRIIHFLRGAFRIRPPVKPVVPTWDLHVVLQALTGAPFEPMVNADLKYVTWKTSFLLAITSAARVSELQALDSHPDLSRVSKTHAILRLNPSFIPKTTLVEYLNREIELQAFFPDPSTLEQRAMRKHCPVRALLFYLDRTKPIRKDSQLLISYKAGQLGGKVTKSTVSRWIQETIAFSYTLMGRSQPVSSVRAHSTRAVATSLADLRGVSPSDLCRAATWSSSSVFAKHYRLNMTAGRSVSTQVISAAVAGSRS